jgi:hypothetical protein
MSNQTKKISLLDLEYTKLRKKIGEVEIYNPDKELKLEIENEFMQRMNESYKDGDLSFNFFVHLGEMIAMFIPMLTNIAPLDDVLEINRIIASPSPLLERVIDEVSDVLGEIFERTANKVIKTQKAITDVTDDDSISIDDKIEILKKMNVLSTEHIKDEEILVSEQELADLDAI